MYSADYAKQRIDTVRERLERSVYFYTINRSECLVCSGLGSYDSVNDNSFNITCSTCKGMYWVKTPVTNEVKARVHWTDDEAVTATPGGKYYLGDAYLVIGVENLTLAEQCQSFDGKVSIDGKFMTITKIDPLGALDINRYKVILKGDGSR